MSVGPTELLVLLVVLIGILVAVRMRARPKDAARRRPAGQALSTPVPAELQSRIRTLAAAEQRIQAIMSAPEATTFIRALLP